MKKFLLGAALGGAALYFLDPERGPARRAQALARFQPPREGSTVLEESRAAGEINAEVKRVIGAEIPRLDAKPVKANGVAGSPAGKAAGR
jgi:hypothetical protein